jgi:hypothetical protein
VNVALVSWVVEVKTKSSADSISSFPVEDGLEAVAIKPSGLPVLKTNELPARAEPVTEQAANRHATRHDLTRILCSLEVFDNYRDVKALLLWKLGDSKAG